MCGFARVGVFQLQYDVPGINEQTKFIQFVFYLALLLSFFFLSLLAPFSPALNTCKASSLNLTHLQTTAQQRHVSIAQEAAN